MRVRSEYEQWKPLHYVNMSTLLIGYYYWLYSGFITMEYSVVVYVQKGVHKGRFASYVLWGLE